MKKLFIFLISLLLVFVIYSSFKTDKVKYLALGDSLAAGQNAYGELGYGYADYVADYLKKNDLLKSYTNEYSVSGYRTTDLLDDIKNNRNGELKKLLREADIITISIGANDLMQEILINSDLSDEEILKKIKERIEDVLGEVMKYSKGDIYLVGYYNVFGSEYSIALEFNELLKSICHNENIYFIDIYSLISENKDYLPNPNDIHPSIKGYEAISKILIGELEKNI